MIRKGHLSDSLSPVINTREDGRIHVIWTPCTTDLNISRVKHYLFFVILTSLWQEKYCHPDTPLSCNITVGPKWKTNFFTLKLNLEGSTNSNSSVSMSWTPNCDNCRECPYSQGFSSLCSPPKLQRNTTPLARAVETRADSQISGLLGSFCYPGVTCLRCCRIEDFFPVSNDFANVNLKNIWHHLVLQ